MGAIASGGVRVLNDEVVAGLGLSETIINKVAQKEQQKLERRERLYRDDRPAPDLHGRTVILVDDGLATGATMRAAVRALRQQQPARLVVGVPVSSPETCQEFQTKVNDIVCAMTPRPFHSVGLWYDDFSQTTDDEVRGLLHSAANNQQPSAVGV
jgi:putative phosphoribosyl transferase